MDLKNPFKRTLRDLISQEELIPDASAMVPLIREFTTSLNPTQTAALVLVVNAWFSRYKLPFRLKLVTD